MSKIDTINIGDKAELKHKITKKDIEKFVDLTGDDNRLHVDAEYAAKTSFKKPVVHGMLGASFISTIIGTKIPGDGALWFSQSLEFLLPVRIGDELTVIAEVVKKHKRHGIIELRVEIYNQNRQVVTKGISKVKIIEEEVQDIKEVEVNTPKVKTALVVGGTGGIGQETCLQLAKDGFNVIVHYNRNKAGAMILKEKIETLGRKAIVVTADIRNERAVKEMLEQIQRRFDSIDILVNSTTITIANIKFNALLWDDIQHHLDIHIKGAFNLLKHIVPLMTAHKYGKVIHLSTQAIETPNADWLHYITAKSALHGFTKALAVELANKGIRFNMVSPGMTDTKLVADIPKMVKLTTAARTPLKRLAKPQDIAKAISFLASERSDFMTGETLRVNGGQVML